MLALVPNPNKEVAGAGAELLSRGGEGMSSWTIQGSSRLTSCQGKAGQEFRSDIAKESLADGFWHTQLDVETR